MNDEQLDMWDRSRMPVPTIGSSSGMVCDRAEGTLRVSDVGVLMVCLCDDDQATPIAGVAGMEMCDKHNAARLRSLLQAGWNAQLHVIDADGDIIPVTTAMFREIE